MFAGRTCVAAQRFEERRQRENDAPRLCERIPGLARLDLEIEERTALGGTIHIRHIVVARAPALFLVPCGDRGCVDGEHDLTAVVMQALVARAPSFGGRDECSGSLANAPCERVLHFRGTVEYLGREERHANNVTL
jgi:hypothetical protein